MESLDIEEAREALRSGADRARRRALGYVDGQRVAEVSVYSLNATVVNTGLTELTVLLSRLRQPALYIDYDVLGSARATPAQWLGPVAYSQRRKCVVCAGAGLGDALALEARYGQWRDGVSLNDPQRRSNAPNAFRRLQE
jgi:hypothetical protein